MSSPIVSAVIPTYNRAHCLHRAVDSVLAQTCGEVEVIVVDDGSTDDTTAVVASRYGSDPRVRLLHQPNGGVASARNAGLRAARGELVALLDSDDTWAPWKLRLQVACMRRRPEVGMTWTDMEAVDPDGRVLSQAYLRTMYSAYRWFPTAGALFRDSIPLVEIDPGLVSIVGDRRFYAGDLSSAMVMGNLVHTSTVVLTRERLQAVGGFPEQYRAGGEDYPFHLRTCRLGPVGYLDVSAIQYLRGGIEQIARPENSINLARAFLEVITPIIEREGATLTLSSAMIDAVLAEAHGWLGEALLDAGQTHEALLHLTQSLRHRAWQPRLLGLLALTALPAPVRGRARRAFRSLKGLD